MPTKTTSKSKTLKLPSPVDRLRARPVATGIYTFTFDPADAQRVTDAETAVDTAQRAVDKKAGSQAAKAALATARKKLRKVLADTVMVTVTVEAIGRPRLEELQHDHPPTEQQVANAEGKLEEGQTLLYDPDTYGPAVLAESLTRLEFSDDPDGAVDEITVDEAAVLWGQLADLDRLQIFAMVTAINTRSSRVDLVGKG